MEIKPEDLINYRRLSKLLTGNYFTIRSERKSKNHQDKVDSLKLCIDNWLIENYLKTE